MADSMITSCHRTAVIYANDSELTAQKTIDISSRVCVEESNRCWNERTTIELLCISRNILVQKNDYLYIETGNLRRIVYN